MGNHSETETHDTAVNFNKQEGPQVSSHYNIDFNFNVENKKLKKQTVCTYNNKDTGCLENNFSSCAKFDTELV